MLKDSRRTRLFVALLPVAIFGVLYQAYLYVFFRYTPHIPTLYQSWGYLLGTVLLLARLFQAAMLSKQQDYRKLLTWRQVGQNMLLLLAAWLLIGNIMALAQMLRPFREAMIIHIFLLFLVALVSTRELLLPKGNML